ncbi:MAG: hypothetical protein HC819_13110 [Cyclobacteriaceae bacterium]|nr:hypothetical protein [Cyclobacteriaceae bacterium]
MKHGFYLTFLLTFFGLNTVFGAEKVLSSPDSNIKVEIIIGDRLYYRVKYKDNIVMQASPLSLTINKNQLGKSPKLLKANESKTDQIIRTVWGNRKEIIDQFNELTLDFEGNYSLQFRAYDHGVAYRFVTNLKEKDVIVNSEEVAYRFDFGTNAWLLEGPSYESNFKFTPLDVEEITNFQNSMEKIYLPAFIEVKNKVRIAITEAGLYDYPSLFLNRGNDYENYMLGVFENYALTTTVGGFSNYSKLSDTSADYIAKTAGSRAYPWRLLVISDDDAVFADNNLVYQLAAPCAYQDTDWIRPGKVAWDWWHDYAVKGEDFEGGINTKTYLYQIDFAAKYNIEYILVDWMWTDKYDLSLFNPNVDIKKIIDYGKNKNVGVMLWCPGHTLHEQLDQALDLFSGLGAAGVKADFFGREDQTCIKMYEDIAIAAAKRKMLVDFHGCTKPTGIERTYPNIINYEAVLGNEYNKLAPENVPSAIR